MHNIVSLLERDIVHTAMEIVRLRTSTEDTCDVERVHDVSRLLTKLDRLVLRSLEYKVQKSQNERL